MGLDNPLRLRVLVLALGAVCLTGCGGQRPVRDSAPLPIGAWRVADPDAASRAFDEARRVRVGVTGPIQMPDGPQSALDVMRCVFTKDLYRFHPDGTVTNESELGAWQSGTWKRDGVRIVVSVAEFLDIGPAEQVFRIVRDGLEILHVVPIPLVRAGPP